MAKKETIIELKEVIDSSVKDAKKSISGLTQFHKDIFGFSSTRGRDLINNICNNPINRFYLELGVYRGATLISAALGQGIEKCYGVDNFCYNPYSAEIWNSYGWSQIKRGLSDNLERVRVNKKVSIIEKSVLDFSVSLEKIIPEKMNVVHFDIDSIKSNEITDVLTSILPVTETTFILIVSNFNSREITQPAVESFLKFSPLKEEYRVELKNIARHNKESWWNGMGIFLFTKQGVSQIKKLLVAEAIENAKKAE